MFQPNETVNKSPLLSSTGRVPELTEQSRFREKPVQLAAGRWTTPAGALSWGKGGPYGLQNY